MECIKKGENMKIIVNRYDNKKGLENVLWYGGVIASIECDDKSKYEIAARGIVSCKLVAKKDFVFEEELEEYDDIDEYDEEYDEDYERVYKQSFYRKGEVIAWVKDKGETELFYKEMKKFIKDDEHLVSILTDSDETYELDFDNNNWIELSYYNPEGEAEYDVVLDDDDICNAIKSVMEEIRSNDNFKRKEHSIYCRSALYSEGAIEKQIKSNLDELKRKYPDLKQEDVNIYVDNGFGGLELNNPAFLYLLDDLKTNNMKDIYTTSIDRISRNIINVMKIQNDFKDLNTDIYCSKEKIYLKDAFSNMEKDMEIDYEK